MSALLDHFRFAARMLRKSPGFTITAVLTLALGIGANTGIFTIMNTLMLRPLPYPEPHQLVSVYRTSPQSQRWPHSPANYHDYREQNNVFQKMAAFVWRRFSLAPPGQPAESIHGLLCTADFFSVLGVPAAMGSTFAPDEDRQGKDNVVVLSHHFWMRRFGGDPNIIGKTIRMDATPLTVIGVMPASFEVVQLWSPIEAWRPWAFAEWERNDRGNNYLQAIARLKPGVSLERAGGAMKSLAAQFAKAYPENNAENSVRIIQLNDSIGDEASQRIAWMMLCLSGFVLLIACVNLANLQLARGAARAREFAVRLALGSGRMRLMGQSLFESLLIAALGGGFGILISMALSNFLGRRLDRWSPEGIAMPLDWRVLTFALACALVTGLVFGVGPAWIASKANMNDLLKSGARGSTVGRSQHFLRHSLIVGEVAIALVLLTGATLFIGGLKRFTHQQPGWDADQLLTGWVPNSSKFAERHEFIKELEQRLSGIPGVRQAAISTSIPIWSFSSSRNFTLENQPIPPRGQEPLINNESVTPAYFGTMGIQLVQGRLFTADDDTTNRPSVIVINQSMAQNFWPAENPIGKRIVFGDRRGAFGWRPPQDAPEFVEVVGVVKDLKFPANVNRPDTRWQSYRPMAQDMRWYFAIQLRTIGAPESVSSAVRQVVADIDPDLPVNELQSARLLIDTAMGHLILAGKILMGFAALGLILAAVGIYGVISFLVVHRTGEIGIRMALGAQTTDVLWLIIGKALALALAGVGLGLLGAIAIASILSSAVPELPSKDPAAIALVAVSLVAVAICAAGLPALRATKCDPTQALRCE